MPEISEAELAVKNRALGILERMAADPKTGMEAKRKIKEIFPEARFPELDIQESIKAPLVAEIEEQKKINKTLADRLDNWEKSQKDSKEESALQSQLDSIKKSYSFTSEGMQKVIDRMKEKNNPDADSAAAWVARQEKKARPVTDSALLPSALNLYGSKTEDENWAALNKDPVGWADQEMLKIINEFADQEAA